MLIFRNHSTGRLVASKVNDTQRRSWREGRCLKSHDTVVVGIVASSEAERKESVGRLE